MMAAPVAIQLAGAMEMAAAGGTGNVPKTPTSPVSPNSPTGLPQGRIPSAFVNLNVREVFEQHGLEHTKEISKKVNVEIEKKKEELRMLVGERYRDLIDAADTIAGMSSSSETIFGKLGNLRQKMSTLPTQLKPVHRTGFNENECNLNEEEMEMAFELKLSLEAPRVVQKYLDEMKVIAATHVSLLYDKSLCQSNKPYKWSFLHSTGKDPNETKLSIKNLILKACDEMMEDFATPPEKLAECVTAKQVLLNSSCDKIILAFLSKRIEMSKNNLLDASLAEEVFVLNISKTLRDIYTIFIDGQLYSVTVKEMRRPKITVSSYGIKNAPKTVDSFNNGTISVEDPIRPSDLAQILLNEYVQPLKLLLNHCFEKKQYLVHQKSFEQLNDYQKQTLDTLKDKTEDLMRIVLGTSKSLWSEAFYPVFQNKCEQVGKLKLDNIFKILNEDAFPKYEKLDKDFNLVEYIWKASAKSSTSNAAPTFSSNIDVDLKLKCISPQIADICGETEQKFIDFQKDFKTLGDFSLKKYISEKILENWRMFLDSHVQSPTLFLGRFVSSLPELCPTIWKLMDLKDSTDLRQHLTSISEKCWTEWSRNTVEKFSSKLGAKMTKLENHTLAEFMPVAELYTPEGDDAVTPSVRIPLQISHWLHSNLFMLCNELSRVGPQSIPKRVREDLRHDIGSQIISLYKKLIDEQEEGSCIPAQTALQLIFDIKFCQWFHLKLKEKADPVIKSLQSVIDPFDMDIVQPKLKSNLKRFLFETHLTIGLLFSEESHSFIAQNFKTKMNMSFPVSNAALKSPLPLLPV